MRTVWCDLDTVTLRAELPAPVRTGTPLRQRRRSCCPPVDGLEIVGSYNDYYGTTEPPTVGDGLPEWAFSDCAHFWYEPFATISALSVAIAPFADLWVLTISDAESALVEAVSSRSGSLQPSSLSLSTNTGVLDARLWTGHSLTMAPWICRPWLLSTRYRDDAVPTLLARWGDFPVYRPDFDAEGGNLMSRERFVSDNNSSELQQSAEDP